MKNFSFFLKSLFIGFLFVSIVACSDDEDVIEEPQMSTTIADIAASDAQFSTLVSALARVNLVDVLDGTGQFTVFAPTNAAFTALGVDLATISDAALTEILLYHVVDGELFSNVIADGQTYVSSESATGPNDARLSLLVEKSSGVTINNNATVITADIEASNGVIHVIDQVLLPLDIVGHASANERFTSLVGALGAAEGDLVSVLSSAGPFTVFAPVNEAFDAIASVTATLTADQLASVLTYHVVSGNVRSNALTDDMSVTTVNGENFSIDLSGSAPTITDANGGISTIVITDVQAKNGVIHVLDTVILPVNL